MEEMGAASLQRQQAALQPTVVLAPELTRSSNSAQPTAHGARTSSTQSAKYAKQDGYATSRPSVKPSATARSSSPLSQFTKFVKFYRKHIL